ncbi:chorismate-binding protein [Corynebacterium bovis]|uniref:isochorismate synthase n=1 Tax=Corynebacterium bovis TaxID=36808 RepID=UPI0031392306
MSIPRRPATAPDFLLSRATGSIRTQGTRTTFPDAFEAATALRNGDVDLVVGAVPFDTSLRAALVEPERVITSEGPLEPPAFFRGREVAEQLEVADVTPLTTPQEHQANVAAALRTIGRTTLEKVVLARAVDVTYAREFDPLLVAARMIDLSAACDGYAMDLGATGHSDDTGTMFMGSSPEMLIRRQGRTVTALPLAGSAPTVPDPVENRRIGEALRASTKDLREHRYVVDHYRRILGGVCSSLSIPDRPGLTETNEMWHLGTPVRGTLRDDGFSALDLALMLHPTPAVGGTPTDDALGIINQIEHPRRFYAGFVGWCDSSGDGEYMVSLRGCEIGGQVARAWAGGGIVAWSSPGAEAAETTAKFQTALRALNVPAAMRSV